MAYLNLRDRLFETKIAYIGASGVGTTTNLRTLRDASRPNGGDAPDPTEEATPDLLVYRPDIPAPIDGCSVVIRLDAFSLQEASTALSAPESARDLDAIVLVVDARPSASEARRASVGALRSLLATHGADVRGWPPVTIVQANTREGEPALSVTELANELETAWPVVTADSTQPADAARTLHTAVDAVIARQRESASPDPEPIAPRRSDAHPLLQSLRRALQETMSAEASAMESRLFGSFVRAQEEQKTERAEHAHALLRLDEGLTALAARLDEGKLALERVEAARLESDLRGIRARTEVEKRAEATRVETEKRAEAGRLESEKRAEAARQVFQKHLDTALGQAAKNQEEGRVELRRQIADARAADVARSAAEEAARDARLATGFRALAANLDRSHAALLAAVESVQRDVGSLVRRVEEAEARNRTLEGRLTTLVEGSQKASLRLSQLVETTARTTTEKLAALEEKQAEDTAAVSALVEQHGSTATGKLQGIEDEIAKRKKTWFG
jgi:hypothetical protein